MSLIELDEGTGTGILTGIVAIEWAMRLSGTIGPLHANGEWLPCVNQGDAGLDGLCQLWSSGGKSKIDRHCNGECGEAVAQILDESVPANNEVGGRSLLEATHGVEALLEMSMIAFHPIIEILRCPMLGVWEYRANGRRVAFGFVGGHSCWYHTSLIDGASEESFCCFRIPPL
jgi:hypothetical protein